MNNQQIVFTYSELIEAIDTWYDQIITESLPEERPPGETVGEIALNHIISIVNANRQKALTSYAK